MADNEDIGEIAEQYDQGNDYIDFEKFVDYYRGEMSKGSIVQYMRYLSKLDFNPIASNPEPDIDLDVDGFDLSRFDEWARKKSRDRFGTDDSDRNSRNRFRYFSYLALKKYLNAVSEEKVEELPSSGDFTRPSSNPQEVYYSREQVDKMIENAESDKVETSIILLFYAGLRSFELLHLTPEWLEFKEEKIEIEIPAEYAKGQKENRSPENAFLKSEFSDQLKDYITDYYSFDGDYQELLDKIVDEELETEPVFNFIEDSSKSFRELMRERYYLNQRLSSVAEKAGINDSENISAHKLRKSFIHHIYEESPADLNRTALLARHQSSETTQKHYLRLSKKEQVKTYENAF